MKLKDVGQIGQLALLGAGVYLLWKIINKAGQTADDAAAQIAKIYADLFLPPPIGVYGSAILPNGAAVPMQNLFVNDQMQFTYAGHTYKLTSGHDANGNYPTAQLS
jgi:hypothetical protein